MNMFREPCSKPGLFHVAAAFVVILLLLTSMLASAEDKIVTQATLLDRVQIEDMLVKYYADMSAGKSHDLARYYTVFNDQ